MERVIIIEVADQHGKLTERFRTSKFPIRVGRAYDNDLIIGDPYVCPHHCEVLLGEAGEIIVNDLSSINGTFTHGEGTRSAKINVDTDSQLRIGHTVLHFRQPDQDVAPTLIEPASSQARHVWPPRSVFVNIAVLVLGAVVMTLSEYLDSYNVFEYGHYFFSQQIPAILAVAGWAAIWSIVSRVTAHHFSFFRHASILVSVILVISLSDYLLGFLKFGFAIRWPFEVISIGTSVLAITLLLFWHLRLCSDQRQSRLMIAASLVAVVLVSLIQTNNYLDRQEFHSSPLYPTNLKPPAFQMVKSQHVDEFLMKSELLKKRIEREMEEKPNR